MTTALSKRSRDARTRGPDPQAPLNVPDADTPGWGRRKAARLTTSSIYGEQREMLLRRLRDLALGGLTDFEIAREMSVSTWMLNYWANDDPAFAAALDLPKALADKRVERALYHRAVGYSYRGEKIMKVGEEVVRVPVVEHVPPDLKAIETWLYNRQPADWAPKTDLKLAENVNVNVPVESDPRRLAMAMLTIMRKAMASDADTGEAEDAETAEAQPESDE